MPDEKRELTEPPEALEVNVGATVTMHGSLGYKVKSKGHKKPVWSKYPSVDLANLNCRKIGGRKSEILRVVNTLEKTAPSKFSIREFVFASPLRSQNKSFVFNTCLRRRAA